MNQTFPDEELPTRPDHPSTVARRCKWCGRVYGEHVITRPSHGAAPRMPCLGLRKNFDPEDSSNGDRER